MLNSPYNYVESGMKAGIAKRNGDEVSVLTETRWFTKAKLQESELDQKRATSLFNAGFRDGVNRP